MRALLVALLLVPLSARAQATDYDPLSDEWTGTSQLAELAGGVGLRVETTQLVDWGTLDTEKDLLVVLYPTNELVGGEVASWIAAGGRILLADDFGKCDPAFLELGLRRSPARGVHPIRWHEDNPALPIAAAWADAHPLARDVDELVTNHPAVFRVGHGDVVFGFAKDEAVVVAGTLGEGRYVALSDPSVLINGMLAFDGNFGFAANLVAWLRPARAQDEGGGRLILLTQSFVFSGEPPEPAHSELGLPGLARGLSAAGRALRDLDQWLPDDPALRAGAVLAAFALVLLGFALLPLAKVQRLDGAWTRAHGGHARADFEKLVESFDDPRWDGSFAWPAAVLRDNLEARLEAVTGLRDPFTYADGEIIGRVERARGARVAQALAAELPRIRALPTREQAAALYGKMVHRRDFERLYDSAQAILRSLG